MLIKEKEKKSGDIEYAVTREWYSVAAETKKINTNIIYRNGLKKIPNFAVSNIFFCKKWMTRSKDFILLFLFFHRTKIKSIYCPMFQNFPVQLPGMCTRDIIKHLSMNIFLWKSSDNCSKKSFDTVCILILIVEKN